MAINFLGGDDYGKYLDEQDQMYRGILRDMGIL
jgi:hypothetical protein